MQEANTDVTEKKIKIARTRSGVPCLWESTMKFDDLRRATTILGKKGEAKAAVFVNAEKEKQALIPIQVGDHISKAFEDKHGIALSVFRITEISSMENTATIVPIYRKSSLITEYTVPNDYKDMINTSMEKLEKPNHVVSYLGQYETTKESMKI
jgi:hypothetical protein